MTLTELKSAYDFGKSMIQEYKNRHEDVPAWVIERTLELADEIIYKLNEAAQN